MKPVHYIKSNDKITNTIKIKAASKIDKKNTIIRKLGSQNTEAHNRPGSSPANNNSWVPSRNWHKYFSGQEHQPTHLKSSIPTTSRPKAPRPPSSPHPQVLWPNYLDKSTELHLTKPPDELVTLKLPPVNFCSAELPEEESYTKVAPSISDLCEEDKKRIALLVEELAKYKQDKQEDDERILLLKNKITELKTSLRNMITAAKHTEEKNNSVAKSLQTDEQAVMKKQLLELNKLLVQMQVQKATSDVQIKTITVQAEKMTRALHALHRENTDLQVELRVTKDRLNAAQQAVDKMSKDLKEVQENMKASTEDKACQSCEDIGSERVCVRTIEMGDKVSEDQHILNELFFNKSLAKNNFTPKETIIFLPSGDYNNDLFSN